MSKTLNEENLISTFPAMLAADKNLMALAASAAKELVALYESNDIFLLYTRIDELDEGVLDILAYDFKVDWWDENYSIEEKRATFKSCWHVHRTLGTPYAVKTAVSAIFEEVELLEWFQYNGAPYRFKLLIDTGDVLLNYNKLERIIERVKFYKNLRSILERVEFSTAKSTEIYVGSALHGGESGLMSVPIGMPILTDEEDHTLFDELDEVLVD